MKFNRLQRPIFKVLHTSEKENLSYYLSCYTTLTEGQGRGTRDLCSSESHGPDIVDHAIKHDLRTASNAEKVSSGKNIY